MSSSIAESMQDLLHTFRPAATATAYGRDVEYIKIEDTIAGLSFAYEKIRNAIDANDEHVLRRAAIERIIKRKVLVENKKEHVGRSLIIELIRGRYLEKDTISVKKAEELDRMLAKYLLLAEANGEKRGLSARHPHLHWLLNVASFEMERALVSPVRDDALAEAMYQTVRHRIDFVRSSFTEQEQDIQVLLALYRALFKADHALLRWQLFVRYYPDWKIVTPAQVSSLGIPLTLIHDTIEGHITHPLGFDLQRKLHRPAVYFTILRHILLRKPERNAQLLHDQQFLNDEVRSVCAERYKDAQVVLRRSARRAIIYIFVTKILLALALEIPYDYYLYGEIKMTALGINTLFHPLLMFFIAVFIQLPNEKNTTIIQKGVMRIVHGQALDVMRFKKAPTRSVFSIFGAIFYGLYSLLFVLSFGVLVVALRYFDFSLLGGVFFLFFLSLVSFFGLRIRQSAKRLVVVERSGNFLTFLFDALTLPIVRAGRWLSVNFARVNIFIFIFDFIIEAPFKMLVELLEELFSFIREKKEEVV